MNGVPYVLLLLSTILCITIVSSEDSEKCGETTKKLIKTMNEILKSDEAPACAKELEIKEVKGDGSKKEQDENREEFRKFLNSLGASEKKKYIECFYEVGGKAFVKIMGSDDVDQECMAQIAENGQKKKERFDNGEDVDMTEF